MANRKDEFDVAVFLGRDDFEVVLGIGCESIVLRGFVDDESGDVARGDVAGIADAVAVGVASRVARARAHWCLEGAFLGESGGKGKQREEEESLQ